MQNENATNGLKTSDFYFDLPEELIAQDPLLDRSGSRLLVLDKETGKTKHETFKNIINYLENFLIYKQKLLMMPSLNTL